MEDFWGMGAKEEKGKELGVTLMRDDTIHYQLYESMLYVNHSWPCLFLEWSKLWVWQGIKTCNICYILNSIKISHFLGCLHGLRDFDGQGLISAICKTMFCR